MLFGRRKGEGPVDYIVVGLGNPGMQYEGTRHNAGFMAIDALAASCGVKIDRMQFKALTARAEIEGIKVLLMKPQTFMNASGEAVAQACRFYKTPPEHTVILFDDISLPVGVTRIRRKGSDGGHRGMMNIQLLLNSEDFPRVKIGVGAKPHPDYDLAAWVLSKFDKDDMARMEESAKRAAEAVRLVVQGRIDDAMNGYSS